MPGGEDEIDDLVAGFRWRHLTGSLVYGGVKETLG
ncbi:hypothetical protein FAIPA1_90043 [Frankia sp. AiPs1]